MQTRFDWDTEKAAANLRKHRIGFEEAVLAFLDPNAVFVQDRFVEGEEHWQVIGQMGQRLLVSVAHTMEEEADGDVYRIISARQVNRSERRRYAEANG